MHSLSTKYQIQISFIAVILITKQILTILTLEITRNTLNIQQNHK